VPPSPAPPAEAPPPALPWLPEAVEALRAVLGSCGEVKAQLKTFRQELQGAAAELNDVRRQSAAVKQGLVDAEQVRRVREELQNAEREATEVKERSQATRQELAKTEDSLGVLRRELEAVREDLKVRFREAGARFYTLGEACQELQRQIVIVREELGTLSFPKPVPPAKEAPPALVLADGHGAVIEPPRPAGTPATPALELDADQHPPAGKKLLGVTVGPDAVVVEVLPETPAEKAGLEVGDVVVSVDGQPVKTSAELRTAVDAAETGKDVLLTVNRSLETLEIPVQLSELLAT
jgi:hypothetical protein